MRKLDAKSKKGVMVGYVPDSNSYRVFIPEKNCLRMSRDVVFKKVNNYVTLPYTSCSLSSQESEEEDTPCSLSSQGSKEEDTENESTVQTDAIPGEKRRLRDRKLLALPKKLEEYVMLASLDEPSTYTEELTSEHAPRWK